MNRYHVVLTRADGQEEITTIPMGILGVVGEDISFHKAKKLAEELLKEGTVKITMAGLTVWGPYCLVDGKKELK